MAKDRKKLLHIHSSIPDKQPTAASLEVGEIAVNNAANQEFLSIRNSEDKVKRFSSDEQIITWIEKKEVMPYEGYTRGSNGPTGSTGPNSVTNNDLLQNKSNLIIKLNQVAASNTAKHNKVNGSKDIYGKCVNPTTDDGVTDGAGFAIDMSRYAMIGANPSFSSLTVTVQTDLSGNTTIGDGASGNTYGTDTGHTLTIKTTDVVDTNTNWTETITNRASTVTNETDKITTLNESATTRTTVVGTENLHVSGTTTEVHDQAVTITNNTGVTETTKGDVVENVSGTTTINHSGTTTTNESGDTIINTTGNTTINSTGSTTIQSTGAGSDITIYAKDMICETSDNIGAFKGANTTNIGSDCSNANQTKTLNVRANTADTRVTSAYTSATTATTIIGTSNASATTATLSGNTLTINEATSISAKTPSTTISGTNLTLNETNTTISSCGKVDITTDKYSLKQCSNSGGTADFEFCNGFNVKTNAGKFEQCSSAGTFTIIEKDTSISGENLTISESGNTTITSTGTTTIESTGNGSDVCLSAADVAGFRGGNNTKIGKKCDGSGQTTVLDINGTTINETGNTVFLSATTNVNVSADTICLSGKTGANVYAPTTNLGVSCGGSTATTINVSGTTINEGGTTINNKFTNYNITGTTKIDGNTTILSALTVSGDTYIGGTLHLTTGLEKVLSWTYGDVRTNAGCSANDSTNFQNDKCFIIPRKVSDLTNWNGTCYNFDGPLCVTGTITASGAIYSSDRDLKENIEFVAREDFNKAKNIPIKSFNLKEDNDKNKMYGVIAQEVQEAGLNELVYTKEDGHLAVDYTSLMMLKIAYLENFCAHLNGKIVELEDKLAKFENKD